jgi:ribosomal protein S21|tara:strand:- start:305 stop:532 length:228 start_codon:yes stop_codon:yes gene_type:complete
MAYSSNVEVRIRKHETVERLIKRFNKKVKEERIVEECRERMFHIKPSVLRRQKKAKRKRALNKLKEVKNGRLSKI